ncbi:MAG: hypothetical protein FJ102_12640 [Deltaproteobacteria bacterium]|nr:hypothetical protein [Deltaproteobacteria bacterium]
MLVLAPIAAVLPGSLRVDAVEGHVAWLVQNEGPPVRLSQGPLPMHRSCDGSTLATGE